ncbi:MAG: GNAT family N-acetyltransferase [Bacillota bacterium]|nr:GNAT family N-acetyltransferase [Bacillota bacterium]
MKIKFIDNIETLIPIFISTFNSEPWNEKWTNESAKDNLFGIYNSPNFYGLVFLEKNRPIGAILGNIKTYDKYSTFHIEHLFVSPDYQRQGVASKLYHKMMEDLKQRKVSGAFFTTLKNSSAYSFYIKHGAVDLKDSCVMLHSFKD